MPDSDKKDEGNTPPDRKEYVVFEPETTPSILANIPECLHTILRESSRPSRRKKRAILISSNSLANRFILERWGIRPSQRRRFRNLFASVRKQCHNVLHNVLKRKRLEWDQENEHYAFGVYKFDEIRGNLILGFVEVGQEAE